MNAENQPPTDPPIQGGEPVPKEQTPKEPEHRLRLGDRLKEKIMHKNLSPEQLAEKWEDSKVALPKMPFFDINLYQYCGPIFFLFVVDLGVLYAYSFLRISPILQATMLPLLFMVNYWLYIVGMSKICALLNKYYEKQSPPHEGLYSREFTKHNVADRDVHFYHLRGFMYKWPVWVSKKSIFPWLVNFVLRDIAGNKIHKNAMYGDAYVSLEFTELEEGAVVQEASVISSHVVDSIFGNLTIERVTVRKNGVMTCTAVMAPGGVVGPGSSVGPKTMVPKKWVVDRPDTKFVWGVPAKQSEYYDFLEILPERFQSQWKEKQAAFSRRE